MPMRIFYFTHSLRSCWNHGNAHFQRGLLRELAARGHDVVACEPADGWSRNNLVADHGELALQRFDEMPNAPRVQAYGLDPDAAELVDGADLVIVHEWTDPALIKALGEVRKRSTGWLLLFHDTHHRAVSDPDAMRALDLSGYDGVLAFGRSLAEVYERMGWRSRVFVMHEAADTRLFRPSMEEGQRSGIVWIGNWGDDERSNEIATFLLRPARNAALDVDIYGVRYPQAARAMLAACGARYHGWLANADVPSAFARHRLTVHVPRRFYATVLPGIPTIRVFEALACGIPLVSAPWDDSEGLFRPGEDYLLARDGAQMQAALRTVALDDACAARLVRYGLERIRDRHTCSHRADELISIVGKLRSSTEISTRCA